MKIRDLTENRDYVQIAQQNVDNHLGDVIDDPTDEGAIYDNVVALAYDAVVDAGGSHFDAQHAAEAVSAGYHRR